MNNIKSVKAAVIGGDFRCGALAKQLCEHGIEVVVWGIDIGDGNGHGNYNIGNAGVLSDWHGAVCSSSTVILPLPVSYDGIHLACGSCFSPYAPTVEEIISKISPEAPVFGGKFRTSDYEYATKYGVRLVDYYEEEEVKIRNAVPSAEGAVSIAMNRLNKTIDGSRCAVVGYGRLGRVLADILSALGARVTVAARKPYDLAWIRNKRFIPLNIAEPDIQRKTAMLGSGYDVVFNTVPYRLFDKNIVPKLNKNTIYIDLASSPGGFDMTSAEEFGIEVIRALSIPGKYAPETAGKIICDYILDFLRKEEIFR